MRSDGTQDFFGAETLRFTGQKAIADDSANGFPVDPSLNPRFAAHWAAQELLDPNTPGSSTLPLEDLD